MPTVQGVTRFELFSSLDDPADGWTADVALVDLWLTPDDGAVYSLPVGLLDAVGNEALVNHVTAGPIIERTLTAGPAHRLVQLKGLDAMATAFRTQRRVRYVPSPAPAVLEGDPDPTITVKVGFWSAQSIAADLLVGTGLTLFWSARDYVFAVPFDGIGAVYDLLRALVEPWSSGPLAPLGVDVLVRGTIVYVIPRVFAPTATDTLSIAASRLEQLRVGPRRQLPLIGLVVLEGRLEPGGDAEGGGVVFFPGDPPISESSELTVPFSRSVEKDGVVQSVVEGYNVYRMPDRLLVKTVERVHEKQATGFVIQVKEETTENQFEASVYGAHGPLNQPLPLSSFKSILTRVPSIEFPGETVLSETDQQQIAWDYDARRFLVAKTTKKFTRIIPTGGTTPLFREAERLTETWEDLLNGWVTVTRTRTTFDQQTGLATASASIDHQDGAGFRPGGIRQPFGFDHLGITGSGGGIDPTDLAPVTLSATISADPSAIPVRYSNPNLTRPDLQFILDQLTDLSGAWEIPVSATGPAMPWLAKGAVLELTGLEAPDGVTSIPVPPALVRTVHILYEDSEQLAEFRGDFEARYLEPA